MNIWSPKAARVTDIYSKPFTPHTVTNRTVETTSLSFGSCAVGKTPHIIAQLDLVSAAAIRSSCPGNLLLMETTLSGHGSDGMSAPGPKPGPRRNQDSTAVSPNYKFSGINLTPKPSDVLWAANANRLKVITDNKLDFCTLLLVT